MNPEYERARAALNAKMKEFDDAINAKWRAKGVHLEIHHEVGCKVGRPQVLANDFAEHKESAIETLDRLTHADLLDLRTDVEREIAVLVADEGDTTTMKMLAVEVERQIASVESKTEE
jgi:hypothetical protein